MSSHGAVVLCPGQGAQSVGMGRAWCEKSPAARGVFEEADAILAGQLERPLSRLAFEGPAEILNRTDVSQPAIFVCSIASWRGLNELKGPIPPAAAAGLSLGEYTALHLAGVFSFEEGLNLVALRGRLMQEAAEASEGGMVAITGADEGVAESLCARASRAAGGALLVAANFNAPGQVVLSGSRSACASAVEVAAADGLRATPLTVAGAFHSDLMQPAAERMAEALCAVSLAEPAFPVWSNVTAQPHAPGNPELLRRRLVEQVVRPVRWAQTCRTLAAAGYTGWHELAPSSVLRGLMRRIDRSIKVQNHDQPDAES